MSDGSSPDPPLPSSWWGIVPSLPYVPHTTLRCPTLLPAYLPARPVYYYVRDVQAFGVGAAQSNDVNP